MDLSYRIPKLLQNLKTHPGGHWGQHLFDDKIKIFWQMLASQADPRSSSLELHVSKTADELGVNRLTLQRWLKFLAHRGWLTVVNANGGRGRGIIVHLTWLAQGRKLTQKAQAATIANRNAHVTKCKTATQVTKAQPLADLINRAHTMKDLRTALEQRMVNIETAREATTAIGRMLKDRKIQLPHVQKIIRSMADLQRIPVPRWVKCTVDIHRWVRGWVHKVLRWGASWWRRFDETIERRCLKATLVKLEASIATKKPCHLCKAIHTRLDWIEGRDDKGKLNCVGWARVRLSDMGPPLAMVVPRERPEDCQDPQVAWQRYHEERHEHKADWRNYVDRKYLEIKTL